MVAVLDLSIDSAGEQYVEAIQSLARNVNLMVTSRPLPSIEQQFRGDG